MEGIIYRDPVACPARSEFGPWQTVWKRHRRYAGDETWDRALQLLVSETDTVGGID